jgi:hypothetical protein
MAKFLSSNELNSEVEKIVLGAKSRLLLISPYIKLHDKYARALKSHLNNPELEIIIVFGKNEDDLSKSMKLEDFNLFKEFPNIQIRYEKHLHAKYYANEFDAILTSMNLYSYSQDKNIEAGVKIDSFDDKASEYFGRVIDQSDLLFHRAPHFEKTILRLSKKYIESRVEVDTLSKILSDQIDQKNQKENFDRKNIDSTLQQTQEKINNSGFCIRTGVSIPFNVNRPLSNEAYKAWSKYNEPNYPEKYCHFSGEPSKGETSVSRPILKKNWKKAKDIFNL